MIVLFAVATATLIGFAILSNASLQSQVSGNHVRAAQADYLAESGLQVASYYLQRDLAGLPSAWAGPNGSTIAIQASGVTVSGMTGSFDISATRNGAPDTYSVVATAHSAGATAANRIASSTVRVVRATPNYSAGFGGPITVPTKTYFNGGSFVAAGAISGAGTSNISGGTRTAFQSNDFTVPSTSQLNFYGGNINNGTYTMPDGTVGTPQIFTSDKQIYSPSDLVANSNNPGHVFYFNSNVFFYGGGVYNATILAHGKVEIENLAVPLTINRVSGFPAIVTEDFLKINGTLTNLTVNGVVYAGKGTSWAAGALVLGTTATINGALLIPSGKPLGAPGMGTMIVNYTPANNDVVNLTTTTQAPLAVKFTDLPSNVTAWNQN